MDLLLVLLIVVACSMVIMFACNSFEDASDFLGRDMAPGIKGATINAIGSSLPELFTTFCLLFLYFDEGGLAAGIATCAGSAVFNAALIPFVCLCAVMWKGVYQPDGTRKPVSFIELDKRGVARDGFFFITAEILLIWFLSGSLTDGKPAMAGWMGWALMAVYVVYFATLMMWGGDEDSEDEDEDEDDNEDEDDRPNPIIALLTFDFNGLLFAGRDFKDDKDTVRAWVVLLLATSVIGGACYFLSEAVIDSGRILGIPPFFTAVILGAAATSVPDTILSVKDAVDGDYDDAVSNAVGSNIFDITVCLGLPLAIFGLFPPEGAEGIVTMAGVGSADVQILRIALIVVTVMILALFLIGKTIGKAKAAALLLIYIAWTAFVVHRGASHVDAQSASLTPVEAVETVQEAQLQPPTMPVVRI